MFFQVFCLFFVLFGELSRSSQASKQLIVVSLPNDKYYRESFSNSVAFIRQLAEGTDGLDDFVVLYSKAWEKPSKKASKRSSLKLGKKVSYIVIEQSLDLWMRDFGLVLPKKQIKFGYRPKYLKSSHAKYVDNEFRKLLKRLDVSVQQSNIVIDGGNVVDNNKDKAILSERILAENKNKSKEELKKELEDIFKSKVAFIPDPKDTTGHSDGIVSFIEENVLLIGDYKDPEYYTAVEKVVKSAFSGLKTVKLGCNNETKSSSPTKRKWRGFSSAVGSYVNILVTNNAVYVPQFDIAGCDQQALEIIRANTKKAVVPINTAKLSHMGGSVRCMSWQMESSHPVAKALLKQARKGH